MNAELTSLIRLCLNDGVLNDKELKVIYDKAQVLGISEAECEVIIESLKVEMSEPIQAKVESVNETKSEKTEKRTFQLAQAPESERPEIELEAKLQSDVDQWELDILRTVEEEYEPTCNSALGEFTAHHESFTKLRTEVKALEEETAKTKKTCVEAAAHQIKTTILEKHKCQVQGKFEVSKWLNASNPSIQIKEHFVKASYDMSQLKSSAALKWWGVALTGIAIIGFGIWFDLELHWGVYAVAVYLIWFGNKRRKKVEQDWKNSSEILQKDDIVSVCDDVLSTHLKTLKTVKANEEKLNSAKETLRNFKITGSCDPAVSWDHDGPKYKMYS